MAGTPPLTHEARDEVVHHEEHRRVIHACYHVHAIKVLKYHVKSIDLLHVDFEVVVVIYLLPRKALSLKVVLMTLSPMILFKSSALSTPHTSDRKSG